MKLVAAFAVLALSFSARANVNVRQALSPQGQQAVSLLEGRLGHSLSETELTQFAKSERAIAPQLAGDASMEVSDGLKSSRLYCLKGTASWAVNGNLALCAGESGLHTAYGVGGFGIEMSLSAVVMTAHLPGECSISQSFVRPIGLSAAYYGGGVAIRFRETESLSCNGYLDVIGLSAGFGGTFNAGPKEMMGITID